MAESEIHQELGQLFDYLIPYGVEHGVMVAERIEGNADHDERKLCPWEGDLFENTFPRHVADKQVEAEHRHDTHGRVDRRAVRHGGRSDEDRLADLRIPLYHKDAAP